jgi:hypothetical protein
VKVTSHYRSGDTSLRRGRKSIILLEGSQASPACPDTSDMSRLKVKTLEWLETMA